jgi:regulator of cell morphogenesis and NO signaling
LVPSSTVEIITDILQRFHAPLRRDLPGLVKDARSVEQRPGGPGGLAEHLEQFRLTVTEHLDKEEKILFPLLSAGRGALAMMPIKVMMAEHEDHLANLKRLRALTSDYTPPAHANDPWRRLYDALASLESDLLEHIRVENQVLFPCAIPSDDDRV